MGFSDVEALLNGCFKKNIEQVDVRALQPPHHRLCYDANTAT